MRHLCPSRVAFFWNSGFSFVYLVQDVASGRFYALKKIRCPFGSEGVQDAMKEAEMYRIFQHENVIKMVVCAKQLAEELDLLLSMCRTIERT
jgi:serine/threonine protein kinase